MITKDILKLGNKKINDICELIREDYPELYVYCNLLKKIIEIRQDTMLIQLNMHECGLGGLDVERRLSFCRNIFKLEPNSKYSNITKELGYNISYRYTSYEQIKKLLDDLFY